MEALPFATKPLESSIWGSGHRSDIVKPLKKSVSFAPNARSNMSQINQNEESSEEPIYPSNHFEYMPSVLLNSMKRDKKPFTYTPGRLDLNEVLNAKLQKRKERKKKNYEQKLATQNSVEELPVFHPPKQVLVMPTYNSPLDMYSMENALEALEAQAEIAVTEKSLSTPQRTQTLPRNYKYEVKDFEPKSVTQSKAFKVLQIITDTDGIPDEKFENSTSHLENEMSFKGTGQQHTIPAKYFHTLQKMTGTDNNMSERPLHDKVFQNNADQLNVESRFAGIPQSKVIPSKYFQNLQRLTGTEESESPSSQMNESRVPEHSTQHFQTETRFTGTGTKGIPSKYFHNLQRITGTDKESSGNPQTQAYRGGHGSSSFQSEPIYHGNKLESNERPFSLQPKSFPANMIQKSIPLLQRPAAFLPSPKKMENFKKSIPRTVRFSSPDTMYSGTNNTYPYEGTDF